MAVRCIRRKSSFRFKLSSTARNKVSYGGIASPLVFQVDVKMDFWHTLLLGKMVHLENGLLLQLVRAQWTDLRNFSNS